MRTLFIAGLQRSGTTLLSVMLGKHPEIYMEDQSVTFRIMSAFNNACDILPYNLSIDKKVFYSWLIKNDYKGRLAALLDHQHFDQYNGIKDLIEKSIENRLEVQNKTIWADKAPNLQFYLSDLLRLIPGAKIIHIIRDGRANAYSVSRRSYQNLFLSAQQWVDGNIHGIVNRDIMGSDQYLLLKYEDLLLEPESTLQQVCDFLSIPFSSVMLDLQDGQIPEEKRYVKTQLDRKKIDNFKKKLSARELAKIEAIQGPLLQQFGYELINPSAGEKYQPLSLFQRIAFHQAGNFAQIFQSRRRGMIDRENVELNVPFKNRVYNFLMKLTQDVFSERIFKTLFSRVFYKKKYYGKDTSNWP